MARLLIIQENGRHAANREFRECFSLQRAWTQLGHEADVWGLGHANFRHAPDFNRYDVILNVENYDEQGWLPDLSQVTAFKLLDGKRGRGSFVEMTPVPNGINFF